MLLLKGVPEAAMCQLVLAGWEQRSRMGGGAAGGTNGSGYLAPASPQTQSIQPAS